MMFEHGINKCRLCDHYISLTQGCSKCEFEWAKDYPPCDDKEFNIFELNDDLEWGHLQLLDRLHYKGIDCLFADMWNNDDLAILIGCKADEERIAEALNIHKECIYIDYEHGLVILNLFQEKYLRRLNKE